MGYDSQPSEKLTLSNIAYQVSFPTRLRAAPGLSHVGCAWRHRLSSGAGRESLDRLPFGEPPSARAAGFVARTQYCSRRRLWERLFRSSIRRHQSEIMFGVLVVVLGRHPIACLEFSLGQRQVPVIVSSRIVRPLWIWAGRTRCPPLRAASRYPSWSTRIHVCLSAILHGSFREIGR
jgi:hypothetical protein